MTESCERDHCIVLTVLFTVSCAASNSSSHNLAWRKRLRLDQRRSLEVIRV